MTDTPAPVTATPASPRWSIPRPEFVQLLGFLIVAAWIVAYFMHLAIDQTLTNVIMIIVGYFYGSSTGSRTKDATINTLTSMPPPAAQ